MINKKAVIGEVRRWWWEGGKEGRKEDQGWSVKFQIDFFVRCSFIAPRGSLSKLLERRYSQ